MESINISVANITGNVHGISPEDGQKVYELVKKAIRGGHRVVLSFLNVEIMTTAFLNTAIGQVYRDFSEDRVREFLQLSDMPDHGMAALKRVVETAKIFYNNPEALKRSVREIMGE